MCIESRQRNLLANLGEGKYNSVKNITRNNFPTGTMSSKKPAIRRVNGWWQTGNGEMARGGVATKLSGRNLARDGLFLFVSIFRQGVDLDQHTIWGNCQIVYLRSSSPRPLSLVLLPSPYFNHRLSPQSITWTLTGASIATAVLYAISHTVVITDCLPITGRY